MRSVGINYSMRNTFLHDHYIYLKFKKNKVIGLLSIINSSVCLVISPIVGYYCDKHKKERIKILQIISITYLLVNIIHYMFIRTNSLSLIIFVTAISKMLHECSHVITESIFIESIDKGKKSIIFTYQKLISTVATIFLWKNSYSETVRSPEEVDLIIKKNDEKHMFCFSTNHIPYIVFISHIITLAGAGMTFKYFSLYLKSEYKFLKNCQNHWEGHRSVFQNCTNSIDKSILYDFIDTNRYTGGWLSDISSYRHTFKITRNHINETVI
ncbi:RNA polymerase subunit [Plasmodium brasilianum]|uniref:RNA polymerase subunit n=1 Tax=Plasmodium brasilianum TaxID=5824 RepID=A0ACB9Y9S0_PLABR|nr:RNA polymerase subunit [Plasmodium brasilianum]